jgi:hypothetical protein
LPDNYRLDRQHTIYRTWNIAGDTRIILVLEGVSSSAPVCGRNSSLRPHLLSFTAINDRIIKILKGMKMVKKTSLVVSLALVAITLVTLGGCCYPQPGPMQSTGIPQFKYLVGGGFQLKYTAPVDGTVHVADSISDTMLMTESLNAGETFSQSLDPTVQNTKEGFKALGLDLSNVRLKLYFVPDSDMPAAKQKMFVPKTSKNSSENSANKCKTNKGKEDATQTSRN